MRGRRGLGCRQGRRCWTSGASTTEAANRGAYAGVVHGIVSRPKSNPKPAATPAGGPLQPQPPHPRDAFTKALPAIFPALDRQGKVC